MLFLVVNFHYIEDENKYPYGGIYPVSPERLSNQIDELGRFFQFIGQKELISAIKCEGELPEKSCLITFDDGLISQYENALPILKKKGIPAMFFVNSLPFSEQKVLTVHKIHWLRAHSPVDEFIDSINNKLKKFFDKSIESLFKDNEIRAKADKKYRYDDKKTRYMKFLLNNLLNDKEREMIIGETFKDFVASEKDFVKKFYLSQDQISDLYKRGWLGVHSHSHSPLADFSDEELKKDIDRNKKVIEKIVGGKIGGISYPYGGVNDVNKKVASICQKLGIIFGFTMERSFNITLKDPLLLARADTNDVIGGKHPAFRINNRGKIEISGDFGLKRRVYIQE